MRVALASVPGGARTHAEWVWLTGSRVAQDGDTPLRAAAYSGQEEVIKALLAGKADVNAKNKVRGGEDGGCLQGKEGGLGSDFFFCGSEV